MNVDELVEVVDTVQEFWSYTYGLWREAGITPRYRRKGHEHMHSMREQIAEIWVDADQESIAQFYADAIRGYPTSPKNVDDSIHDARFLAELFPTNFCLAVALRKLKCERAKTDYFPPLQEIRDALKKVVADTVLFKHHVEDIYRMLEGNRSYSIDMRVSWPDDDQDFRAGLKQFHEEHPNPPLQLESPEVMLKLENAQEDEGAS